MIANKRRGKYLNPKELMKKQPTEWTTHDIAAAFMGCGSYAVDTFTLEYVRGVASEIVEHGCVDLAAGEEAQTFVSAAYTLSEWAISFYRHYLNAYGDARSALDTIISIELMSAAKSIVEHSKPIGEAATPEAEKAERCRVLIATLRDNIDDEAKEKILKTLRLFSNRYRQLVAYNALIEMLMEYYEVDSEPFVISKKHLATMQQSYSTFISYEKATRLLDGTGYTPINFDKIKVTRAAKARLKDSFPANTDGSWVFLTIDGTTVQELADSLKQ